MYGKPSLFLVPTTKHQKLLKTQLWAIRKAFFLNGRGWKYF